jgi:hypothetical protein
MARGQIISTLLIAMIAASLSLFGAAPLQDTLSSSALQAPRMALDMQPTGNTPITTVRIA